MYMTDPVAYYLEGHTIFETAEHCDMSRYAVQKAVKEAGAQRPRYERRTHKLCPRCREHKPLSDFHVRRFPSGVLGPCGYCKPCTHVANTSWRYGLEPSQYEAMLEAQQGLCAICGQPMDTPHLDHDHETGVVRDLLCGDCNQGLGRFGEDIERMQRAIAYVLRHQGGQSPST